MHETDKSHMDRRKIVRKCLLIDTMPVHVRSLIRSVGGGSLGCVLLFVLVAHSCVQGVSGRHTLQDCLWRTSISSTLPEIQEAVPRPSCEQGEVWWYYPLGALKTHFRHEAAAQDFTLCLQGDLAEAVRNVTDVTMGNFTPVKLHVNDGDVCLESKQGSLDLLFAAPVTKRHVAVIRFYRKPP